MDEREFREEIQFWNDYYDDSISDDEFIMHYGIKRRSGRYPWGSGKESYQRTEDFIARLDTLKKSGMSEKDIATAFGLTTTELRIQQSMAKAERRAIEVDRAVALRDKGYSLNQIAKEMGYANDSSIRSLLNESTAQKMNKAAEIAELLKKQVDTKGMIDVGAGIELELGVSKEKLNEALYMLKMEGYDTFGGGVAQVTNAGKQTTLKVLCPPGTEHKEIYNYENVHTIKDYDTLSGEMSTRKFEYPASVDMNRIHIRYAEDGGVDRDGTIELRRGVPDLDLGGSHYSQVRILTNGTHYLKGMAVYKDDADFPDGCDIIFNTNKAKGTPPEKVFKAIKNDPNNPFGSTISPNGQSYYTDPKTGQKKLSAINKRADEGEWNDWSLGLPSQFLGKQKLELIRRQLGLAKADKMAELDEIMNITNPVVRKKLLSDFAEDADSAAADLKAAALPRQRYQVILPIPSLKDNEVYAPNFKDGETVCLVRFPHGGTFEIPTLVVNNKNKDAISMLGKNPKDAICINSKVAERLSGADFDGDTALVIPVNSKVKIRTQNPLKGLEGFDNKKEYPARPGMKILTEDAKGREMGVISNLITDMTLKGASPDELARAVRHSMVVIDAAKHKLDYKKSEADHGIAALKKRYQSNIDENGNETHGASTLLSRAKSPTRVEKRTGTPKINEKSKEWYDPSLPEGALIYNKVKNVKGSKDYDPTQPEGVYITRKPQTYIDRKTGKEVVRTEETKLMKVIDDARKISSGTPQEELYVDYANSMKALANEARKAIVTSPKMTRSPEAAKEYAQEVSSLKAKLNNSLLNAPKERQAQLLANDIVNKKVAANPDTDKDQIKKLKQQALTEARAKFGAKRNTIDITDNEWEAIQKGAVSENVLEKILQNADIDSLRSKATPRNNSTLSDAKLNKMQAMKTSGYTNSEIAEALGVSASTISKYL